MRRLGLLLSSTVVCAMFSTFAPAFADADKEELVQIIRQQKSNLDSIVADKTMSFNMTPEWWQYFCNRETRAYEVVNLIAICLMHYTHNAGGDDIEDLDQSQDASSPLVIDAINKMVDKAHCTIEFLEPIPADKKDLALQNLKTSAWTIRQKTVCKPRAHKLNITLTVTPKARTLTCTISPDKNNFHFLIPSSIHVEAGEVENFFRKAH